MFSNAALRSGLSAQEGSITQKIRDNLISGPIEEISVLGLQIQHSHTGRKEEQRNRIKTRLSPPTTRPRVGLLSISSQLLLGSQNKINKSIVLGLLYATKNHWCEREVVSDDQHVRARYKRTCKTIDTLLSSLCTLSLETHSSRTTTTIRYYTTYNTAVTQHNQIDSADCKGTWSCQSMLII